MVFVFHADFLNLTTTFSSVNYDYDLALPSFAGRCRYNSNQHDFIKNLVSTSASKCHVQCQITHNCVAFAFSPKLTGKECDLYEGGPYTIGNGRSGSTCYIMSPGKPIWLYYYIFMGTD